MFIYHNENPNGYKVPDCVIRALTLALKIPYIEIVNMLDYNGKCLNCETLNVRCYEKLLDNDLCLPHYEGNGETAKEIVRNLPNDTILLRMDGHLSCAICGNIYDLFNCEDEVITDFWIVPN